MWSMMFLLFTVVSSAQAFREVKDMNWTDDPAKAWTYSSHAVEAKVVMLVLNKENYTGDGKQWKFIASGVLLDNSRILTSYNPFKQLISDPNVTEHILALISAGYNHKKIALKIANLTCARQIANAQDDETNIWCGKERSPIHDLMVIRMDEEIGIAKASYRKAPLIKQAKNLKTGNFAWFGQLGHWMNSVKSIPAVSDALDPEVKIFTLGYKSDKQMRDFDTLHEISYTADDAAVVDCEEWLPRQWGYFICIRNIGNFSGLGSGAALFSKDKLFGIGSFAMFKLDQSILVFTDVRHYDELIRKTCTDREFIPDNVPAPEVGPIGH